MDFPKSEIIERFSESVDYYDEHATIQKKTAERLANALQPWKYSLPEGPIIEVGAGTGFFSKHLIEMYPGRELILSDISDEMVHFCENKFSESKHVSFQTVDVETVDWPENQYSLIAGNFVAQWLKHPAEVMSKMTQSLKPGGFLLMSFPGSESFPQWRKYCLDLGIPFTANRLPDIEEVVVKLSMGPVKVDYYEDQSNEEYNSVYEFYDHLKRSGTATSINGKKISAKQLELLNNYWKEQNGGKIYVHYHTAFIAVKRDL